MCDVSTYTLLDYIGSYACRFRMTVDKQSMNCALACLVTFFCVPDAEFCLSLCFLPFEALSRLAQAASEMMTRRSRNVRAQSTQYS